MTYYCKTWTNKVWLICMDQGQMQESIKGRAQQGCSQGVFFTEALAEF